MTNDDSKQGVIPSSAPPAWWDKLKPLAREMRHNPTPAEDALWQALRNRQVDGLKFRRQHAIERFIVDFYCAAARLVIEVDGPIHALTPEQDVLRQRYLESRGLRVIRITNGEIETDLAAVIARVRAAGHAPP